MKDNLERMFAAADDIDRAEGRLAYARYNQLMRELSEKFSVSLDRVVAAFVSLSPNSDYVGNLRSTVSVLEAVQHGYPIGTVVVSTYNHCRDRAYAYATGQADFLEATKGKKILNFYHNLLAPDDPGHVTIDGHVSAAWQGKNLTMREALINDREYEEIKSAVIELASSAGVIPNQYQAILWFARKRTFRIKYDGQLDLFAVAGDSWRVLRNVTDLRPYPRKVLAA